MESPGLFFEICATKDKIKGVLTGLSLCHGDLLRHNNDRILFSNNWCFLWYHNIANTWYSIVVPNCLIRTLIENFKTGLSHLKYWELWNVTSHERYAKRRLMWLRKRHKISNQSLKAWLHNTVQSEKKATQAKKARMRNLCPFYHNSKTERLRITTHHMHNNFKKCTEQQINVWARLMQTLWIGHGLVKLT